VNALHKLTSQRTLVKRNGVDQKLPSEDLVVGDLIYLSEGQQVSADAIIVSATDLSVDESILTGESVPVVKNNAGEPLVFRNKSCRWHGMGDGNCCREPN
jgi:Ca2+-transporting ATPase